MNHAIRLSFAAAALALGAAMPAHAQGKIVVQSWGGPWADAMKAAWFDPFEKATGVKVELRPQGAMMEALAKLKAAKDKMDVDVWVTGLTPTALADEAGIVATIPRDRLTNARHIPANMISDKWVAAFTIFYGAVYNKEKTGFEMKSWNDMFDPRLKGKLAVPHATGYTGKFIVLLAWLGGGGEKNIDPGFALANRLKPNIAVISRSDPESIKLLTSGEVAAAMMMPVGNYLQIRKSGPQFVFVAPEPYVPANFNNFAVMKNSPNNADAIRFVDFAIGKAAQEDFARRVDVLPANSEAKAPDSLAAFAPPREKMRFPDDDTITKNLPAWADRWNREIQTR